MIAGRPGGMGASDFIAVRYVLTGALCVLGILIGGKLNAEIEWFEKYATKRPYTWEKAPGAESKDVKSSTDAQ